VVFSGYRSKQCQTEEYDLKKTQSVINKLAKIKKKDDKANQLNYSYKAPEKSHATEELAGYTMTYRIA